MATILSQGPTGDGYDVRILTAGEAHTLHFQAQLDQAALAEAIRVFSERLFSESMVRPVNRVFAIQRRHYGSL